MEGSRELDSWIGTEVVVSVLTRSGLEPLRGILQEMNDRGMILEVPTRLRDHFSAEEIAERGLNPEERVPIPHLIPWCGFVMAAAPEKAARALSEGHQQSGQP